MIPLAVREAVNALSSGDTLLLNGKEYYFTPEYAYSSNCYYPLYGNPPKNNVFEINDLENIVIDGEGAELILDGDVCPFALNNCKNVKII